MNNVGLSSDIVLTLFILIYVVTCRAVCLWFPS